jgi:hypothetical protein
VEVATGLMIHLRKQVTVVLIPSNGEMHPTVIEKSQPIESVRSKPRDHTRTFVRARSNSGRTSLLEKQRLIRYRGVFFNESGLNQSARRRQNFSRYTTTELNMQRLSENEPNEAVLVQRLGSQGKAIRVVIWRRAR